MSRLYVLFLLVLLAALPLWGPGIVNTRGGGDSPFLLQRVHQMAVNLRAGVLPARWMPDAAYGLGYPFFNHYAALPFYLAAGLHLLGLDLLTAIKLTQTLGFLFAALAMYGWVYRRWKHRPAAWLAAVAYTVAPFHLVNVYVRGDSLSEFYAFIWFPLVLWAVDRVVDDRAPTPLALTYAGLVLTHNLSAFIFSPFALLYLLVRAWKSERRWRTLGVGGVGLLMGLALSAWFWLPAFWETRYAQTGTLTLGYFNYANHFRAADLVQLRLLFDYSIAPTPGDPGPFAMGGPQALLAVAGVLVLLSLIRSRRPIPHPQHLHRAADAVQVSPISNLQSPLYLVTGLLLATFMITPLSRPLWDHLPLLEVVQFPWRFLSVQALFAALLAAALTVRLSGWRAWGGAGSLALLLAASTLLPLRPDRLLIGPEDVTVTRLQEYELFTGNIGTTIRWEWLPRDAVPRPFTSDAVIRPDAPPQPVPLSGALVTATQIRREPTAQSWRIQTGPDGATLAFPLLYWPGWQARMDGADTPVWPAESAGYLTLTAPPGDHIVHLSLSHTPLRAAAEAISLVALLVMALYHVPRLRFAVRVSRLTFYALRLTPYILPLILLLILQPDPPPARDDDLAMDFVDQPYLHHNPDGVDLGGAWLLSYDLSADRLSPGDVLTVTLAWDPSPTPNTCTALRMQCRCIQSPAVLRLVSPAEHLPDLDSGPLPLAESRAPLAETTIHTLRLPENTPRGLYLLQVKLEGSDHAPLYLRPVRVSQGAPLPADAPVLARVGPDIRLHAAALQTEDGYLVAQLEWSTLRPLAVNYGVSVRLLDPDGNLRLQRDTQPGYGFAPTSLWRPGERIGDRYNLPLPGDLPPGDGYRLLLILYRFPSGAEVGRAALGPFSLPLTSAVSFAPRPRQFDLPALSHPLDVDYGGQIRLAGYELVARQETLDLTLWWVAQTRPLTDYTVFVHLFDPATNQNVAQDDAMPRRGTYPTSGWLPGEVVSDTVRLDLSTVPPGDYRLGVGLYDAASGLRLPATAGDAPVPDARLVLPDPIEVSGP